MLKDLVYISALSTFFPILFGVILFKDLPLPLKILLTYLIACGVIELWAIVLFANKVNNLFLFHIQIVIEFGLLAYMYFKMYGNLASRWIIIVAVICLIPYLIFSSLTNDLSEINSVNRIIESSILLTVFISYIVQSVKRQKTPYIELNPYLILTFGLIIYFSGALFVFLFSNYLDKSSFLPTWTIHNILNIFVNIIYASVIWRSRRVLST